MHPPDRSTSFRKEIGPPFTSLLGDPRATHTSRRLRPLLVITLILMNITGKDSPDHTHHFLYSSFAGGRQQLSGPVLCHSWCEKMSTAGLHQGLGSRGRSGTVYRQAGSHRHRAFFRATQNFPSVMPHEGHRADGTQDPCTVLVRVYQ